MDNEELIIARLSPDMQRIWKAITTLIKFGGNGSVEIHFVRGKIKIHQGLYIKPGFDDSLLNEK